MGILRTHCGYRQLLGSDVVIYMVAKVLEFLCLQRLEVVFPEADLPHVNQTAYRRSVSCADAIFTSQEVVAKYLNRCTSVFMTYRRPLIHAVEYAVLMDKLFEVRVNGKMWHLLRWILHKSRWYSGCSDLCNTHS